MVKLTQLLRIFLLVPAFLFIYIYSWGRRGRQDGVRESHSPAKNILRTIKSERMNKFHI